MAERRGKGHRAALVKDGDHEHHVLVVLDGAVGQVRIVEPVDVPGARIVSSG
jgi:hypothetical protein